MCGCRGCCFSSVFNQFFRLKYFYFFFSVSFYFFIIIRFHQSLNNSINIFRLFIIFTILVIFNNIFFYFFWSSFISGFFCIDDSMFRERRFRLRQSRFRHSSLGLGLGLGLVVTEGINESIICFIRIKMMLISK